MTRKGLGRGLSALIDTSEEAKATQPRNATDNSADTEFQPRGVIEIDIRKIEPNREQPRKYFDDAALAELAESIKIYGLLQPLILQDRGEYYKIIAGERRFRAARIAGFRTVPAIIKDYSDVEILQVALIENIQRQDLTPIEEAVCYKRLIDDYFFTVEAIAEKIGKNRAAISNIIKLLELDSRVQELVSAGRLTISHARLLLALKDADSQFAAAEQVAEEDLSVRATEILISKILLEDNNEPAKENVPKEETNTGIKEAYRQAEADLQSLFGAKVSILQGKKKGKIEIEYYTQDELDRLLGLFKLSVGGMENSLGES